MRLLSCILEALGGTGVDEVAGQDIEASSPRAIVADLLAVDRLASSDAGTDEQRVMEYLKKLLGR